MKHWRRLLIIVCSNDDLDLFYSKVKFGNQGFSVKKSKKVDFSKTIAACDLKLIELMKISGYFLTLAQGHLHMKIKICIFFH